MLGKMFQGMNQGGMYSAGLQGMLATVGMLKGNGQDTGDLEMRIHDLAPKMKALDGLYQKILGYAAEGKTPPKKLTDQLERRSDALTPLMDGISEEIEALSENMGESFKAPTKRSPEEGMGGLQKGLESIGKMFQGWGQ
jgi:hypothetical protein